MSAFLTCRECNKVVTRDTKFCPYCGAKEPAREPEKLQPLTTVPKASPPPAQTNMPVAAPPPMELAGDDTTKRIQVRYLDAYRVTATLVYIGSVLKVVGITLGLIGLALTLSSANDGYRTDEAALLVGGAGSVFVFTAFFVLGVIISALAQVLRAGLDQAVHSSPFLDDDQRLVAMGIRTSKSSSL